MQPGEPGIVHDEMQQLARGFHASIDPLVGQLLGNDQRFVKAQKTCAEIQHSRTEISRERTGR